MRTALDTNNGFRPARRRTFSIAAVFDKKKEDSSSSGGLQEASKAASIIESSPVPTSPTENTAGEHGEMMHKQNAPDTPPASPQSSFSSGRSEQLAAQTRQQRHRPQTPMDFTFQSMGFGLGNSRASIDDVRTQLAAVRDELKSLQEKLEVQDLEIKGIRTRLDQMMERYEEAILDAEKTTKEKDNLKDQVQRLRSAWTAEREARKELEEEIESRLDKERQLQARIRRMSAQDSLSVLARARRPAGDGDQRPRVMERSRRGTVNGSSLRGSYPFNQSSPRELEL
ncbi:uncharacterized protein LY89DRAFT_410501 [Mollisia scopiformis]|uniref:Uncharacterized protein n=1 Tax=Mollisia scopiformis TaxID=149040 RepID=A0A132B2F7_MOLSC|nr:uncharacterized protein LY89DRAFT_410501 [Mollisia scopiformis]KUJ06511.1 hypothetical protein LY89DRAFT_410501 [Mollisia scopiformis]